MISNDLYVLSLDGELGSILPVSKVKKTPVLTQPLSSISPESVAKQLIEFVQGN
jgi:hypothetical protein